MTIYNTPRAQKLLDAIEQHKRDNERQAKETSGFYQQRSSGSTGIMAQRGMGSGTAAVVTFGREGISEEQLAKRDEQARIAAEAAEKARRKEMQTKVAHLRKSYMLSRGPDRRCVAVEAAYVLGLPTDEAGLLEVGTIFWEQ